MKGLLADYLRPVDALILSQSRQQLLFPCVTDQDFLSAVEANKKCQLEYTLYFYKSVYFNA